MIAFYLPGGVPVYAFSLILGMATTFGLAWVAARAALTGDNSRALRRINAGLWAAFGALLAGRLIFVLLQWAYFQDHLAQALQVFRGGLSWPGALAGGLLALLVYARIDRLTSGSRTNARSRKGSRRFNILADDLLPLAGTLAVAVWLGCWLDGTAYGPLASELSPPLNVLVLPALDEWGQTNLRLPVQLSGALVTLGLLWILDRYQQTSRIEYKSGTAAGLGLLGFSLEMLLLSGLRSDPGIFWAGLRADAWAALAFLLASGTWLITIQRDN
jgi:prolipoprotein diacylglyceryltransferase